MDNFSFCTPPMVLRRCVCKKTRGQGKAHPYPQVRLYVILFRYISLSISIAQNVLSINRQECRTQLPTPQKRLPNLHQTQDEALLHIIRCRCSGRHTSTTPNVINKSQSLWLKQTHRRTNLYLFIDATDLLIATRHTNIIWVRWSLYSTKITRIVI